MKEEISRRFPYFPFLCSSVAWMYSCEDRLKFEDSINLLRALKEAFSRRKTMNGGKERRKLRRGKKKKKQSEISFVSSKMIARGKKILKARREDASVRASITILLGLHTYYRHRINYRT